MNATRDSLAHRFVAITLDETTAWPAELQVMFHELAFGTLPEIILELDEPSACRFARGWKSRIEIALASPQSSTMSEDEKQWLADLAAGAPKEYEMNEASPTEVTRLAELLRRFGPLALSLSWRDREPAKA